MSKYVLLVIAANGLLAAQTYPVIHKKALWPDGEGQIYFGENAIEFRVAKPGNSRTWKYDDVQYFDRVSQTEFIVLTYEDQKWRLGRDRQFHFVITSGELTNDVFQSIKRRMNKPVTNRIVGEVSDSGYRVPVKHLHTFGGCEGDLIFTPEIIYYSTKHEKDAREWRLSYEIESVWSMHPYHLEIHVYDNNRREFSRTRVYNFDLKQPLNVTFYDQLKLRLYGLEGRTQRGARSPKLGDFSDPLRTLTGR